MTDVVFSVTRLRTLRLGVMLVILVTRTSSGTLPLPLFFPPLPPVLGEPLSSEQSQSAYSAPSDLAPFVTETFYVSLSTCLAEKRLTNDLRLQLEKYRTAKNAARAELLARLYTLREYDAPTRLMELEKFARQQGEQLKVLEKLAENLRRDLAENA